MWWRCRREGRRKEERLFPRATTWWYTLTLFVPDACRRRSSNSGRTSGLPSLLLSLSLSPEADALRSHHWAQHYHLAAPLSLSLSICLSLSLSALPMDMLNYFSRFVPHSLPLPWTIDRSRCAKTMMITGDRSFSTLSRLVRADL